MGACLVRFRAVACGHQAREQRAVVDTLETRREQVHPLLVREIREDGSFGPIYFIRYNRHAGWDESNTGYPFYKKSEDKGFVGRTCRLTRLMNSGLPARYVKSVEGERFEYEFLRALNQP